MLLTEVPLDTGRLAEHITDKLPHSGDELLMDDHSSCGEQSVEVCLIVGQSVC